MRIYKYFLAILLFVSSLHAVSIKLDGSGGLTSGVDCQKGAVYQFGTENSYEGQQLDLLVEVISADNDYNNGTTYCTYVKDKTLATNLRDTDAADNVAFQEYKITIVKHGTTDPVEVDRVMLTGYDLDIDAAGGTGTDDFYVAADGAYLSSGSSVNHTTGSFFNGQYTDKMKGWDVDNCDDTAATPDPTCRASSIWINGNGLNKVSTVKVRVQNDNAYGEYTGDSYTYRLIQLSFQIEDFSAIFNGQKEYGDAPSSYGQAGGNLDGTIMLGSGLPADYESSYQASTGADADDNNGKDDESAVTISNTTLSGKSFKAGENVTLDISTYGHGYLQLWFDFNGDGDFEDSGEHVIDSQHINNTGESTDGLTTNTSATSGVTKTPISLTIPSTVKGGSSFVRVRFSEGNSLDEKNPRKDLSKKGEVEDYQISFVNEGTISGTVKDTNNNPLANITIKLMQGTEEVQNTTTNASGNYTFTSVQVGEYTVDNQDTVSTSILDEDSSDDGDTTTNTNTSDKSIPVTITIGENDTDNNFIHTLPIPPGTISGTVVDNLNAPLANATIKLFLADGTTIAQDDNGSTVNDIKTDDSGSFSFSNIPAGNYLIQEINPPHYLTVSDDAGDDATTGDNNTDDLITVILAPSEVDDDNKFVDKAIAGTISGIVKDEATQPLSGANVKLVKSDGSDALDSDGNVVDTITTISTGTFSFSNIPAGDYMLLEVDPSGYVSQSDNGGDDNAANNLANDNIIPVTLTAGENDTDNVFIDKKAIATISGSVTDRQSNGIKDVTITIEDTTGNIINDINGNPLTTQTDVTGYYSFINIPLGDYIIKESDKTGFTSVSDMDSTADGDTTVNTDTNDNKIPVTLTDNKNDTDNNFVDEGYKSISGQVLVDIDGDETGDKGLENVTVTLNSCTPNTSLTTNTDASGNFSFTNLVAGCYLLTEIDPTGYTSIKDSQGENDNNITVSLTDTDHSTNAFVDTPSLNISGNVKADTDFDSIVDTALENVSIALFSYDGELLKTVQTDSNGEYSFTNETPGTYTIVETDLKGYSSLSDVDGGDANTIMITVSESDITGQNFEDQKRITVSGVVKVDIDGDGEVDEPLQNSTLIICKAINPCTADSNIKKVKTDEDGAYIFDDLEPGDYKIVEIDKEGYESLKDVDGANDNTIHLNLTGNGDVTDQDFDNQAVAPRFILLTKSVAKKQASIGDFVPYSISVENVNDSYTYASLRIRDILPAGFKYEKGSAKLIRGTGATAINATGSNIMEFGSFNLQAKEKVTISYLLKVGVSVAKGEHVNTATAKQNGKDVSNTSTASVTVTADPFIDNSVVIGKVFEDPNGNGVQDEGEKGIPGVRLASVTGMIIETDGYGRYHVADAESSGFGGRGSNFIIKVDKATLPAGSSFTTENPRVLRVTASGLNVIDFGVRLPEQERMSKERIIKKITMKKELVEVEKSITIGSIYFDSDQDCIRPNQVSALCDIANKLREYQGGALMIEANTDARAPIWYNKKLAYKRAQSVYKELKHQLGDEMIGKVDVIYDNCDKEVKFNPNYDWWGKPNIPRTKKECTQFGISKKRCNRLLQGNQGGAL